MNHTPDTTTAGNGGSFDPQQAAALLGQTTQQARRQLQPTPPWLLTTRAVMVLAACGAVWLSVRGQHPYRGPTKADIPVLVAFIVLNFIVTVGVARRAMTGVSGRSRLRPAEITVAALAWVAAVAVIATLAAAGVSYSVYPTTFLVIPGLAWAATMAARANWFRGGVGLAVAVVGVMGLLAGPAGAWAVAAVGLFIVLLGEAAVIAWRERA
jgi:hypothetical protein